jgi:hypothetical protein
MGQGSVVHSEEEACYVTGQEMTNLRHHVSIRLSTYFVFDVGNYGVMTCSVCVIDTRI